MHETRAELDRVVGNRRPTYEDLRDLEDFGLLECSAERVGARGRGGLFAVIEDRDHVRVIDLGGEHGLLKKRRR